MTTEASFILENVRIFTGDDFIDTGFVVVQNGTIAEVGVGQYDEAGSDVAGLARLSRPGFTIIPGLIDSHIHAVSGNINSLEQSLRFGVTTVCDLHNDPRDNAKLMQLARDPQNKTLYSDFKCCGVGAVFEGDWPKQVIKKELENEPEAQEAVEQMFKHWPKILSSEDAKLFVKQQIEAHSASYIKIFHELGDTLGITLPSPPSHVLKAIVDAAHDHGVVAIGHALSYSGAMGLLDAGIDGLAHVFLDEAPSKDYIAVMAKGKVHCNPTLVLCASQTGEAGDVHEKFKQDPFAQKMLIQKDFGKPLGLAKDQKPKASFHNAVKTVKDLYQGGVPILVGTDAAGKGFGVPYGLGVHIEMHLLAKEVGMSASDVLKAATSNVADRLGFADRGRIQAGRKADLVLLEGDANAILSDSQPVCLPIKGVWRDGLLATSFQDGFIELR